MKQLLVLVALGVIGYLAWQKYQRGGPPAPIEHPIYTELRVTTTIEGREIEMAAFGRMPDMRECQLRGEKYWTEKLEHCPSCQLQPAKCQETLPPRYARLFDDVPIPSTYLSLSPGQEGEREARLVVYGLTDQEGAVICEGMKSLILEKYEGTGHCVAPSRG